jgi:hypothetical protein
MYNSLLEFFRKELIVQLDEINNAIKEATEKDYAMRWLLTYHKWECIMKMKQNPDYIITEEESLEKNKKRENVIMRLYHIRYKGVNVFDTKIPLDMVRKFEHEAQLDNQDTSATIDTNNVK